MAVQLDAETIERLRGLPAAAVLAEVRDALYRLGGAGSEDVADVYEQLVAERVLSWAEIEALEGS
jgi:hypothetical protein